MMMKKALILLWATLPGATTFAGPIISGGPKPLPEVSCVVDQAGGDTGRYFVVYQTNFSTGDPSTDQFEGRYGRFDVSPRVEETLLCRRGESGSLLWVCGTSRASQGSRHVKIVQSEDGTVQMLYYAHDPVEDLSGPTDVMDCLPSGVTPDTAKLSEAVKALFSYAPGTPAEVIAERAAQQHRVIVAASARILVPGARLIRQSRAHYIMMATSEAIARLSRNPLVESIELDVQFTHAR